MKCPSCDSAEFDLVDEVPEDGGGLLVRLYVWACRVCPRKWATH